MTNRQKEQMIEKARKILGNEVIEFSDDQILKYAAILGLNLTNER